MAGGWHGVVPGDSRQQESACKSPTWKGLVSCLPCLSLFSWSPTVCKIINKRQACAQCKGSLPRKKGDEPYEYQWVRANFPGPSIQTVPACTAPSSPSPTRRRSPPKCRRLPPAPSPLPPNAWSRGSEESGFYFQIRLSVSI